MKLFAASIAVFICMGLVVVQAAPAVPEEELPSNVGVWDVNVDEDDNNMVVEDETDSWEMDDGDMPMEEAPARRKRSYKYGGYYKVGYGYGHKGGYGYGYGHKGGYGYRHKGGYGYKGGYGHKGGYGYGYGHKGGYGYGHKGGYGYGGYGHKGGYGYGYGHKGGYGKYGHGYGRKH